MGMEPKEWIKDLLIEPGHLIPKRLLRVFNDTEAIEIRFCEVVDTKELIEKCVAIVCETNNDHCFVAELRGLFPNIKVLKKIEGEKARIIRCRVKEITNLSGDAALNAFNNLLHDVLGNP
jgi:hypothetical protein